jgi:type I restriction enzyme M protein
MIKERRIFMWGALIGDGVGSVYEFHNDAATEDFDLYNPAFHFTDDSVMTLAVMDIVKQGISNDKKKTVDCFRKWGRRYPGAGYGRSFYKWLMDEDYYINESYGNGAAMRISPVGWAANSEAEVKKLSAEVTGLSHHHPEGLKGAEVTAMMIYLARKKKSKSDLLSYAKKNYRLYSSFAELKASNHGHGFEICQVSVPQALSAFFITNSFDECLRAMVLAGGDTDTTAAIACSIAEAFYGESDSKLASMALAGFAQDPEAIELLTSASSKKLFHEK